MTAAKTDPAEKPTADEKDEAAFKPKLGQVVTVAEGRYAVVVGFEKVRHTHQDSNGAETDRIEREHPLVVDLTGSARRLETETHPL
jgi:hypothetical protein